MSHRNNILSAVLCAAALACLLPTTASSAVRGRAYGIYADLPGQGVTNMTWCDTGFLPSNPVTPLTADMPLLEMGATLHAEDMHSDSHRDDDRCHGESDHHMGAGWVLQGAPAELAWTHMSSSDDDECCRRDDDHYRSAVIEGLTFGGQPIEVTGLPNQIVEIEGVGTLTLNELHHHHHDDCDEDDNEHNAAHLVLQGGGEVIIGSTHYDDDNECCAVPTHRSSWGVIKSIYR